MSEKCPQVGDVIHCHCGKPSSHYGTMGYRGAREVREQPVALTSNKSDDWLPCPFCGGADIRSTRHVGAGSGLHHRGEDVYTMCCYNCGATFPGRYRLELLREAWNRRPTIETRAVNCREAGPGKGLCIECANGHYERCLYVRGSEKADAVRAYPHNPPDGCLDCLKAERNLTQVSSI